MPIHVRQIVGFITPSALLLAAMLTGARADDGLGSTPVPPQDQKSPAPTTALGDTQETGTTTLFPQFQQLAGDADSPTAPQQNPANAEAAPGDIADVTSPAGDTGQQKKTNDCQQVGWLIGHKHAAHGAEGCATCQDGDVGHHHHCDACSADHCDHCGSAVVVHEGHATRMTGNRMIDWWKTLSMKTRGRTMTHYYQAKAKWWNPDRWNPRDCDDDLPAGCNANGDCSNGLWMQKRLQRMKCRFGYFLPTGCCGAGCPTVGAYHMVYSANPDYFDPRDGRVYGAQGYGVPMAVPLAPNVENTYNFGWGIPSSRLTPISRRLPE